MTKWAESMQIYLLRHGIAEEGTAGTPDAERALTPEGKKKLKEVLQLADRAGVKPSLILSSPYRRAAETADLAASVLGCPAKPVHLEALEPMGIPEAVWDEIRTHKSEPVLLLASHEPLMGRLLAYLLAAPELQTDFKKGSLARVDVESFGARPRGILKWLVTAKLAA